MKLLKGLTFTSFVCFLFVACNKNNEVIKRRISPGTDDGSGGIASKTLQGAFLTLEDFKAAVLFPTDDPSLFLANDTTFSPPWLALNDQDLCDKSQELKFQVQGKDTVILTEWTDNRKKTKECEDGILVDTQTGKENTQSVKSYKMVSCSGVDLSEFDGKVWDGNSSIFMSKEIAAKCDGAQTIKYLINLSKVDFGYLKAAIFDDQGKPCVLNKKDQYYEQNNCYNIYLTNNPIALSLINSQPNAIPSQDASLLVSYKAINVQTDKTGPWMSSGSYEIILNQFKGSVTFSGAITSPTYNLKSGDKKLSGNLQELSDRLDAQFTQKLSSPQAQMGLRLTSPAKKHPSFHILKNKFKRH